MNIRVLVACVGVVGIPLAASAQVARPGITVKEEQPGLLARAAITPDSAITIALARVPARRAAKAEIEMEHGKLVYSFDLVIAGQPGVEEVLVDARSGAVISVEHEDDPLAKPPTRRGSGSAASPRSKARSR